MSKNLNRCAGHLNTIAKTSNPKHRDFLLMNLTRNTTKAIIEIVKNLLRGCMHMPEHKVKIFQRNKGFFRKIEKLRDWKALKNLLRSAVNRRALHKLLIYTCNTLLGSESESEESSEEEQEQEGSKETEEIPMQISEEQTKEDSEEKETSPQEGKEIDS